MCVEDFRDGLEDHFGDKKKIPSKLVAVVKRGEKEINDRIKVLKMADRVLWSAVDKYQADPLCDGDEDDKRWKQAVREAKEEKDRRKGYPARRDRKNSPGRYNGRESYYRDRRPYGGRTGGSDGRSSYTYGKEGSGVVGDRYTGKSI